uniref:MRG domain-containing protein n=1 Tax=Macrostomum lignano TaxID=282301 RepID=A0A1I8FIS1_9PLAT
TPASLFPIAAIKSSLTQSLDARLASLAECQRRLAGFRDAQPTELPSEAELAASWSGFISAFAELSAQAGQQRTRALDSAAATIKRVAAKGRRQFQFLRAPDSFSWRPPGRAAPTRGASAPACCWNWQSAAASTGSAALRATPQTRRQKQPSEVDATAATVAKRVGRLGDLWAHTGFTLLSCRACSDSALEFRCLLVTLLLHEYVGRFAYVKGLHPPSLTFLSSGAGLPAGSPLSEHVYYPLSKIRTELSSGKPARLTGADIGLALTKHGFLAHRVNYASLLRAADWLCQNAGTPAPTRDLLLRLPPWPPAWKSVQPDDFRRLLTAAETDADGDEDVENQDLETTLAMPLKKPQQPPAQPPRPLPLISRRRSASAAAGRQRQRGGRRKSAKKRPKSGKEKPQTEPPNADDNQPRRSSKEEKCHNEAE